ncbi:hypothetical protein V5F77_27150 [Xanthobacter sp. DSM 24535]|uniref:AI-2E family transporter n=1 Tax=Xanthobacteraceae TaxID=335928 RepID=UPI003726E851
MPKTTIQELSFIAVVIAVTAAFVWLLLPYYGAILWAVILAILFNPLHRRLEIWLGGHRNLAAAVSVLACICIVVIPGAAILASLAQEAASLYNRISTRQFDLATLLGQIQSALPPFVERTLSTLNLGAGVGLARMVLRAPRIDGSRTHNNTAATGHIRSCVAPQVARADRG